MWWKLIKEMMRRLQHEKQNRNSFCLCEITLRTMRLIQNRYTPKVPSRGQSLLTTFTYIISIRKIPFPFSNSLITIQCKKSPCSSVQKLFSLAFISTKLNTSSLRVKIVWRIFLRLLQFLQSVFQKISNNQRFALANQFHPRAKTWNKN